MKYTELHFANYIYSKSQDLNCFNTLYDRNRHQHQHNHTMAVYGTAFNHRHPRVIRPIKMYNK